MNVKFNAKEFLSSVFFSLIGIVAVLIVWTLGVRYTAVGLLLPTPWEVLQRAGFTIVHPIGRKYTLLMHLAISLQRVLVGFSLSALCGVILGIAMGRFKMVEAIFKPLFELVRPIPSVAWIPLAIVWFGIGETAKIFIIFMAGFVNITVNTYAGAKQVDENMLGVARMLGPMSSRPSSMWSSRPASPIFSPACRWAFPPAGWPCWLLKWSALPRASAGPLPPDRKTAT